MIHGGDIYTDGIMKGKELLDFSSNINPLGVPNSFKNNINKAVESLTRYPDIEYRKIRENLSKYTGVSEEYFILGNGAAEIIDNAISTLKRILITVPSFAEYEIDSEKWECEVQYSFLKEIEIDCEDDLKCELQYDYEDILNKLHYTDGIIIGNPNNPNGGIIDKLKFKEILYYCEKNNKTIIIDEAFIEFTGIKENSFINYIKNYKCLIIIRALTKFFGMPGIRFGYGITSNKELIKLTQNRQNPWNINCFAETAVQYALNDSEYIKKTLEWIASEKEFMLQQLNNIKFIDKVYNTNANYVLCKLKNIDCIELYRICLEKGILIRKADNYRGLDKYYVRFAVKDRELNLEFLKVLKEIENIKH